LKVHSSDVVVVGRGLAGLSAALSVACGGREVTLLADTTESASSRSGGNFRASGAGYSAETHFLDIVNAGLYLPQRSIARALAQDAVGARSFLEGMGLELETTPTGFRVKSTEAPRVPAGRVLVERLEAALPGGVRHLSGLAWDLILGEDGSVAGLIAYDQEEAEWFAVAAPCVILATGGASGVFCFTDHSSEATGDGIAMAFRAGALLADMEFVQFWPLTATAPDGGCTCLSYDYVGRMRLLTADDRDITEQVGLRGLADGTSSPSVVSRLIYKELTSGRAAVGPDDLEEAVQPPSLRLVPRDGRTGGPDGPPPAVTPAAHHTMGGVVSGDRGQTRIGGLLAAGEVAAGAHGADRLSGNGLTEALVMGRRAGEMALTVLERTGKGAASVSSGRVERAARDVTSRVSGLIESSVERPVSPAEARRRVTLAMWRFAGLARTRESLDSAQSEINRVKRALPFGVNVSNGPEVRQALKTLNLLLVAEAVTRSARYRRESRGVHWREDYPGTDDTEGLRHVRVKLLSGEMSLEVSRGLELMET